jgi:DNA-binding transcriptional MerR regulator
MPYVEKKIEKLYYSITEVAEMFGVSNSLLRFWEAEFDIINPRKNRKGNRLFTKKDIENLQVIYHLVKEQGYTLEGARKKLKDEKEGTMTNVEIAHKLSEMKKFLEELNNLL